MVLNLMLLTLGELIQQRIVFNRKTFSWVHESVVSSYTPEEADYLIVDQEGNVVKMTEKTRTAKNTSRPSALHNQSSFNTLSVTESNLDITTEQTMNRSAQQNSMIRLGLHRFP